jgi:hypothetical protein
MESSSPNEKLSRLLEEIKDLSAQDVIYKCHSSSEFDQLCQTYEREIWTYLLQTHFPLWGTTTLTPKEFYIRISEYYGIKLRDTSTIAGKTGEELKKEQTRRPMLRMQIAEMEPFEIPDVIAELYSDTLQKTITFNIENNVTDPKKWIFSIPLQELHNPSPTSMIKLHLYFKTILANNSQAVGDKEIELDVISISNLLQCKAYLCDSMIGMVDERMTRLEKEIRDHNEVFLEEVEFLRLEFLGSPAYVASYLRALADLFYRTDNFNEEWIEYFKQIKARIPNIAAALMPHGYPFTRHQNVDRFDPTLFYVNPLEQPIVTPDYFAAQVCATLDTSGMDNPDPARQTRIWKNGKPYPITREVPNEQTVFSRMERSLKGVTEFIQQTGEAMRQAFPNGEAGFILAGGLPSICFDNWLSDPSTHWLLKTDVDLFVYGDNSDNRRRAFKLLFERLREFLPFTAVGPYPTYYKVWNSVLTIERRIFYNHEMKHTVHSHNAKFFRMQGVQVINTNSRDGFEVIMNFDTSNIQIGWDCHKRWIATPFWSLYTPRREALVVRYNVRSPRFVKNLYRGYTLKTIMPKSLLLTPKGITYSYVIDKNKVITLIPDPTESYADDLKLVGRARPGHFIQDYVDDQNPGPNGEVHAFKTYNSKGQEDKIKKVKILIDGQEKYLTIRGQYEDSANKDNPDINSKFDHVSWVDNIPHNIKYNGKFKNGFDAYVREEYFIYQYLGKDLKQFDDQENKWTELDPTDLSMEEVVERTGGLNQARYVMRDCKIILDPRDEPVKFHGTSAFKFSLRTLALQSREDKDQWARILYQHRRTDAYLPTEDLQRVKDLEEKYTQAPNYVVEAITQPANVQIQSETTDLGSSTITNKSLLRNLYTFPVVMEGIIQLKPEQRENSGIPEESEYGLYDVIPAGKNSLYKNYLYPANKSYDKQIHGNLPIVSKEVYYLPSKNTAILDKFASKSMVRIRRYEDEPFDVDAVDLHERFYSEEEREQLPVYSFDEWQDIRIGKIKLPENVVAIRLRTPVVIRETLFLDQADWTIDVENVLRDYKHLLFNCLCYQNFTSIRDGNITGGEIMIYRSFMVYE